MKRLLLASLFLLFTCLYAYGDTEVVGGGGISSGDDFTFGDVTAASVNLNSNGSAANPSVVLNSGTGLYYGTNTIQFSAGTVAVSRISNSLIIGYYGSGRAGIMNELPTATNPVFVPNIADADTGIGTNGADQLSLVAGEGEAVRVDKDATAGNTRFMLYDVDNGTLERVTVGAADSGGSGYKVLRIPN